MLVDDASHWNYLKLLSSKHQPCSGYEKLYNSLNQRIPTAEEIQILRQRRRELANESTPSFANQDEESETDSETDEDSLKKRAELEMLIQLSESRRKSAQVVQVGQSEVVSNNTGEALKLSQSINTSTLSVRDKFFEDIKPEMRRSYIAPEELKRRLDERKARYPDQAFDLPYVILPKDRYSEDISIAPIHIAAGTADIPLLKACLSVYHIEWPDSQGRTPLIFAIIGNNPNVIEMLAKYGANLNTPDNEGRTPIHWATYSSRPDLLDLLIKLGANWRIHDNEGRSPLHWAASNDDAECLDILLRNSTNFEINEPDGGQMTPLHWAVVNNHSKHVAKILRKKVNAQLTDVEGKTALHWCTSLKDGTPIIIVEKCPYDKDLTCAKMLIKFDERIVEIADLDKRTVLHMASGENNVSLVSILVKSPLVKIDAVDISSRSSLHWAAICGHHNVVNILLDNGASDKITDLVGATPLHYACSKNHSQCVKALMARPSYTYSPDNEGRDPLIWAAMKGHVQTVRILLEQKVALESQDRLGRTALHVAANNGHGHCVALLIEHGANVEAEDFEMQTPIFRATEQGQAEIANMLLQAHATVNKADQTGRTPLHYAALCGHLPVMSMLLANHAEINAQDNYGKTALICSAFEGNNEVCKYLIELGANIEAKDNENLTSLHWATYMGHSQTVGLLIRQGAKVNVTDEKFKSPTPLDFAIAANQETCSEILISHGAMTIAEMHQFAAQTIQKLFRGYRVRKMYFGIDVKQHILAARFRRERSARIIQRAYRSYVYNHSRSHIRQTFSELENSMATMTMNSVELDYFTRGLQDLKRESVADSQRPSALQTPQDHPARQSTTKASTGMYNPLNESMIRYQQQLQLIAQHQKELDELRKATELKISELKNAIISLHGNVPKHIDELHFLPPPQVIDNIQLPYGLEPLKLSRLEGQRSRDSESDTDDIDHVSQIHETPYLKDSAKDDLKEHLDLTMDTAEREYFLREQLLREAEEKQQK